MLSAKKILFTFCLLLFVYFLKAQSSNFAPTILNFSEGIADSSAKLFIKEIEIFGNKKTKTYLILREIPLKQNDSITINLLNQQLEQARQLVYNTTLFTEVSLNVVVLSAYDIKVQVRVKEKWYLYPVPQFKPVDRNFNEWIKTYNASLTRVNYGIKFVHYNLSGRRDQLRIYLLNGFSRDFLVSYKAPYSNSNLTEGFIISAGYSQKKEIAFNTTKDDKLIFYKSDSLRSKIVGSNLSLAAGYNIRKGYFKNNLFNISYNFLKISDSIILSKNNPNYFNLNSKTSANVFDASYTFQYTNVNNVLYPITGKLAYFVISKRGLGFTGGINSFSVEAGLNKYFDLNKGWFSHLQLNGKIILPLRQAYINQRGLGYGENYLRGLEYYVINGVSSGLVKSTLKKRIAAFHIPLPFNIKAVPYLPFTIFAKTYADVGYVFNKNEFATNLNNKFLYTGGFGIDIIAVYDIVLRVEYSFNQLGKKGLFLHSQSGF